MRSVFLISGWLSHATLKPGTSLDDFFQKKFVRLIPCYFLGAIPLAFVCILVDIGLHSHSSERVGLMFFQWVLHVFTVGAWNPAIAFYSTNLPLWFMNNLLFYYYFSFWFINWIRLFTSINSLAFLLISLITLRTISAIIVLLSLIAIYPNNYSEYGL